MLVDRFRCPECGVRLRPFVPQPEGKRIKCPRCARTFAVEPVREPAVGETDQADAPRAPEPAPALEEAELDEDSDEVILRPRRGDRSNHLALLTAAICASVVLLVFAVGLLIYAFTDRPALENLAKVKTGMSQKEVEALIGPGEVVSRIDRPGRRQIKVVEWKGLSHGITAEITLSFEDDHCIAGFAPEFPAPGRLR